MRSSYTKIDKKLTKEQKKDLWDISIGLNKVDNLSSSPLFYKLIKEEIEDKTTYQEMRDVLTHYYAKQDTTNLSIKNEKEADLVAIRIAEFLSLDGFSFSIGYLKGIHKFLFQDVFNDLEMRYLGDFRNYDFTKDEPILNGASVQYTSHPFLEDTLAYDFSIEKKIVYYKKSQEEVIKQISTFTSSIWQVHPFIEGNTRTTAVFIEKYMRNQSLKVTTDIFKDNSLYFRNALVLSNYDKTINDSYLNTFFTKCLYDYNITLPEIPIFEEVDTSPSF